MLHHCSLGIETRVDGVSAIIKTVIVVVVVVVVVVIVIIKTIIIVIVSRWQ